MEKKHLSRIANDVLHRCAQQLETSVDTLNKEFESQWTPETDGYARKLVEFCCSKALAGICYSIKEKINDGSYSEFTFDMMLAWEMPSSMDEESFTECLAKEREDRKETIKATEEEDDIPLFYSDLMPLLVDGEKPSVGEDSFVWLATLVPVAGDVVNGRFTFEALTASTGNRLHFPAYNMFLKEIDKCINHLQNQAPPKGVELADDEFILHVEGTALSQRVVRHIGGTSRPGRLTLTNYALYFEAFGVVSYEDALKLDLSKDIEHSVKPTATGPFGAPLFDKAIVYESAELQEPVVLEFPEVTSSTRRDHWLALVKEIMLLHLFLSKFKVESPVQRWEMHARTILGIIRLHAAREMLRISPPIPKNFLIFTLFDELPKGDYVLEELAETLKKTNSAHPCSASSILRNLNVSHPRAPCIETEEVSRASEGVTAEAENLSSVDNTVRQVREEAKEMEIAKATAEGLKEQGIGESALILIELLKPLKSVYSWFEDVITWKRPVMSLIVMATSLLVVYKEWVGKAIAVFLLWISAKMLWARRKRIADEHNKIVICKGSDQTTIETFVSAQQGLRTVYEIVQSANIAILKIWSIVIYKSPKHTNMVMMGMTCATIILAVVPFKFVLMGLIVYCFTMKSIRGKQFDSEPGNRRLKEWWDSISVIPVEIVDNPQDNST